MKHILFLPSVIITLHISAFAQPGTLDPAFNSVGYQTAGIGNYDDNGNAVAIQDDGKIVVAGETSTGTDFDIALMRFNIDGSVDETFANNGQATVNLGHLYDTVKSVAIQDDRKIVVAGIFLSVGYDVEIQQDGKILVYGKTTTTSAADNVALIRLKTDGTLDPGFGSNRKVSTDIAGYGDAGFGMALQNDSNIVLAGFSNNGVNNDFLVLRYVVGLGVGITQPSMERVSLQPYPNPATDQVTLSYALQKSQPVSIAIEDGTGREVQVLAICEMRTAG